MDGLDFTLTTLTAAINETQYKPGRLGMLGLFEEDGVTTTTVEVEKKGQTLSLVAAKQRGSNGQSGKPEKRDTFPFKAIHLPRTDAVLADSLQNVRAFGSSSALSTVQSMVSSKLGSMRDDIDVTIEHHRMGAIKGKIMDADGTTELVDLYQQFGISQSTVAMALGTTSTAVRKKCLEAVRASEDGLGGAANTGMRAFCGRAFFDSLIEHDKVKQAYERWENGEALRNDPRGGFTFGGITFEEYRGSVNGVKFIGDDEAYLVPEGVAGLFITRFAPGDYNDTVNTMGLPYYASAEEMGHNKGYELEAQSNVVNLCTRPQSVIKLTRV